MLSNALARVILPESLNDRISVSSEWREMARSTSNLHLHVIEALKHKKSARVYVDARDARETSEKP